MQIKKASLPTQPPSLVVPEISSGFWYFGTLNPEVGIEISSGGPDFERIAEVESFRRTRWRLKRSL